MLCHKQRKVLVTPGKVLWLLSNLAPALPSCKPGRDLANSPADVSPAPLSCQKEFFLSSFSCSVQGPALFVLGIAAADHFREIQGIDAFKLLCLVLLCRLCCAGLMCEHRNMAILTCDQETPELPAQICAVSHGASPSAVCLLGNLLLRSP